MSAVALISDLFFVSRVAGTAQSLGVPMKVVRSEADCAAETVSGASLAIIDLNVSGADPLAAIRACKAAGGSVQVVAFLSHVQQELAASAREAGADLVLPRSKFTVELPALLQQMCRKS